MVPKKGKTQVVPTDMYPSQQVKRLPQNADPEKRRGLSLLGRVALAVVVLASLTISVASIMQYNELEARKDELQAEIDQYDDENQELEQLIKAPVDDDYIARMARERLGLHYPDEDVYYSRYNGKK